VFDGIHGCLDHFFALHAQLIFQMDVGGGNEGVDPGMGRMLDGRPGPVDVAARGAGQAGHLDAFQFGSNLRNGLEVTLGCGRETGFDDVDAEFFELHGQAQLFTGIHAGPGRLFTVPQGGIKDNDALAIVWHGSYSSSMLLAKLHHGIGKRTGCPSGVSIDDCDWEVSGFDKNIGRL
jgi:hypothetical protein